VGTFATVPPNLVAQFPQLQDAPLVELSPMAVDAHGYRRAILYNVAPNFVGFREHRVAATVERIGDSVYVLSCTQPLAPGPYAICGSAPSATYELRVK
jgi:hypothetical protein